MGSTFQDLEIFELRIFLSPITILESFEKLFLLFSVFWFGGEAGHDRKYVSIRFSKVRQFHLQAATPGVPEGMKTSESYTSLQQIAPEIT